jgi:hypothetical protein
MPCYLFFFYNPGHCGISDVIARIMDADPASKVICGRSSAPKSARIHEISEAEINHCQSIMSRENGFIIPWVDHAITPWEHKVFDIARRLPVSRILWVHEIWYLSIFGYRMTLRERIKQPLQKIRLRALSARLHPITLATTNAFYQYQLVKAGYKCHILPNTGTIPLGIPSKGEEFVASEISDRNNAWIVASFGSLALKYWDWRSALSDLITTAKHRNRRPIWAILGKGLAQQSLIIRNFIVNEALAVEIHETGELSAGKIDHWLWGVDAGISGHPYALWEKSTGLLAATERRLPTVVPQAGYPEDRFATYNPYLFPSFNQIASDDRKDSSSPVATPIETVAIRNKLLKKLQSRPIEFNV